MLRTHRSERGRRGRRGRRAEPSHGARMGRGGRGGRVGFTLVELLAVIGLILVLVGLMLPAFGGTLQRARVTRYMATVQQNAMIVMSYAGDWDDVYPLKHANMHHSSLFWYRLLVEHGYFDSAHQVDPDGFRHFGGTGILLSMCMLSDPKTMRPGFTVPLAQARSVAVRQHQVPYPANKGMIHEMWRGTPVEPRIWYCCAGPLYEFAIAFADGSVISANREEMSMGVPITTMDGIGIPAYSTWGGYLAIDRK